MCARSIFSTKQQGTGWRDWRQYAGNKYYIEQWKKFKTFIPTVRQQYSRSIDLPHHSTTELCTASTWVLLHLIFLWQVFHYDASLDYFECCIIEKLMGGNFIIVCFFSFSSFKVANSLLNTVIMNLFLIKDILCI